MVILLCYFIGLVIDYSDVLWCDQFGQIMLLMFVDVVVVQCLFLVGYWDVMIMVVGKLFYLLVMVVIFLVFDGFEDCNGCCNYDELVFW